MQWPFIVEYEGWFGIKHYLITPNFADSQLKRPDMKMQHRSTAQNARAPVTRPGRAALSISTFNVCGWGSDLRGVLPRTRVTGPGSAEEFAEQEAILNHVDARERPTQRKERHAQRLEKKLLFNPEYVLRGDT